MTLDEAIIHYRALGECKCEAAREKYRAGKMDLQFAEWLEELKALRAAETEGMQFTPHEFCHDMGRMRRLDDFRRAFFGGTASITHRL